MSELIVSKERGEIIGFFGKIRRVWKMVDDEEKRVGGVVKGEG